MTILIVTKRVSTDMSGLKPGCCEHFRWPNQLQARTTEVLDPGYDSHKRKSNGAET